MNTWQSFGAFGRNPLSTGLDWFSLTVAGDLIEAPAARFEAADFVIAAPESGISARDPSRDPA